MTGVRIRIRTWMMCWYGYGHDILVYWSGYGHGWSADPDTDMTQCSGYFRLNTWFCWYEYGHDILCADLDTDMAGVLIRIRTKQMCWSGYGHDWCADPDTDMTGVLVQIRTWLVCWSGYGHGWSADPDTDMTQCSGYFRLNTWFCIFVCFYCLILSNSVCSCTKKKYFSFWCTSIHTVILKIINHWPNPKFLTGG